MITACLGWGGGWIRGLWTLQGSPDDNSLSRLGRGGQGAVDPVGFS